MSFENYRPPAPKFLLAKRIIGGFELMEWSDDDAIYVSVRKFSQTKSTRVAFNLALDWLAENRSVDNTGGCTIAVEHWK